MALKDNESESLLKGCAPGLAVKQTEKYLVKGPLPLFCHHFHMK